MSIIADLPPRQRVVDECFVSDAQGAEGQHLFEVASRACRHWLGRSSADVAAAADADEESGYRHVPLKTTHKIRVRFKPAQRLAPRQFILENDAE